MSNYDFAIENFAVSADGRPWWQLTGAEQKAEKERLYAEKAAKQAELEQKFAEMAKKVEAQCEAEHAIYIAEKTAKDEWRASNPGVPDWVYEVVDFATLNAEARRLLGNTEAMAELREKAGKYESELASDSSLWEMDDDGQQNYVGRSDGFDILEDFVDCDAAKVAPWEAWAEYLDLPGYFEPEEPSDEVRGELEEEMNDRAPYAGTTFVDVYEGLFCGR